MASVDNDGVTLSICVPTFNRAPTLERQVRFLLKECDNQAGVEIVVSDNCSTDETESLCRRFGDQIRYHRNTANIGAVPNFQVLASLAQGRYFWLVGDDDVLDPGIVDIIMGAIQSDPSYVFANHRVEWRPSGKLYCDRIVGDGPTHFEDGRDFVEEACRMRLGLGQLMFMTASVHRKSILDEVVGQDSHAAMPLLYAFYCASRGSAVVIRKPALTNTWGESCWLDSASEVHGRLIPWILWSLPRYGYRRKFAYSLLASWVRGHRRDVAKEVKHSFRR